MHARKAAGKNLRDVAYDRARWRSHHSDSSRQAGNRTFSRGVEQAFGRQLFLELLESKLQRSVALRLQRLNQKLIFPAHLINVDMAARQHGDPVLRFEFQMSKGGAETGALQLRILILQREIAVPAGCHAAARNFSSHPDIVELLSEQPANSGVKLRDRKGLPCGSPGKRELFHLTSW